MGQLYIYLDSLGISETTVQAAVVALLVFAAAFLVVSAITGMLAKRRSLRAQDEFERLQKL